MNVQPEPSRMTSQKVIHQSTRSQGAHSGTTGAISAHITCENVARDTFPTAPKAIRIKEREEGPDTDLSFRLTSSSHEQDKRLARGCSPTHETHEPAGSCRRTRECYAVAQPAAPYGVPPHQST